MKNAKLILYILAGNLLTVAVLAGGWAIIKNNEYNKRIENTRKYRIYVLKERALNDSMKVLQNSYSHAMHCRGRAQSMEIKWYERYEEEYGHKYDSRIIPDLQKIKTAEQEITDKCVKIATDVLKKMDSRPEAQRDRDTVESMQEIELLYKQLENAIDDEIKKRL